MSYPPLPSNGETQWGNKFRTWADALESGKVEGTGLTLRYDNSVGTRVFLDHPGGTTMLYGNTGWRDITSICADIESGNIHIRRTAESVEWLFQSVVLTPGAGTLQIASTIPTGWRPTNTVITSTVGRQNSLARRQNIAVQSGNLFWLSETLISNTNTTSTTRPEDAISGILVAPATGWPTTLPGTPV